jgi:hypothetical protein
MPGLGLRKPLIERNIPGGRDAARWPILAGQAQFAGPFTVR